MFLITFDKSKQGCTKRETAHGMFVTCKGVSTEVIEQFIADISDTINISLEIRNCNVPKLTQKILENKKIISLLINNCQLKHLNKSDLAGSEDVLETLNLEQNLLINFPDLEGFENIKTLILKNNLIENIPNNVFKNFTNLENLSLEFNKITSIAAENFKNLPHLSKFSLQGNHLIESEISESVLNGLNNLCALNISNTGIHTFNLPPNMPSLLFLHSSNNKVKLVKKSMLKTQPKLAKLFLNGNEITEIENDALEGLIRLNQISLGHNHLELSNEQSFLRSCTNLLMISLSNNRITRVKSDLFKNLCVISDLNLSHNQIEYIEENTFPYQYPEFWFLNLSHNRLKTIEEKLLENLSTLVLLELSNNLISDIHSLAFKNLKDLSFLVLKSNKLGNLPGDLFHNLQMLEILNVSDNVITNLEDATFSELEKLSYCYLSKNLLSSLPNNLFINSFNLCQIYINNNNLTEVPLALQNLPNLRIVDLSDNPLSPLNSNSFKHLSSIYGLYISNCGIQKFPEDIFHDLINLKVLDASFNQIDKVEENDLIPFLSSVLYIDLQGNPLESDASSEWLFSLLKKLWSENPPQPDNVILNGEIHWDEITEFYQDYVITYTDVDSNEFIQFVLKKPGDLP